MKRYTAKSFEPISLEQTYPGKVYRTKGLNAVLLATSSEEFPFVDLNDGELFEADAFLPTESFVEVDTVYVVEDDDKE